MRSDSEMMDLILQVARQDSRIRAVQMQGSRTNPRVAADCYQDFDICYYVRDTSSFISDPGWIDVFGERLMLKEQDLGGGFYLYLMLFTDRNRIDLVLIPVEAYSGGGGEEESEAVLLYAKDDKFKPFPPATHKAYYIKPPIEKDYYAVCKDFWWSVQYVLKGIRRDELPYAKSFLDRDMRDALYTVTEWYIGQVTGYSVSAGKYGRYFKLYLDSHQYERLCKTYVNYDYANIWDSLFIMCDLFREFAMAVAEHNHFIYPAQDDENMIAYLKFRF